MNFDFFNWFFDWQNCTSVLKKYTVSSYLSVVIENVWRKEKLSGRIFVAKQYLCNKELIQLDIATQVPVLIVNSFELEISWFRGHSLSSFLSDYIIE